MGDLLVKKKIELINKNNNDNNEDKENEENEHENNCIISEKEKLKK